ncbi:helix-turn-helix transcriptional regulator [Liquorilactobacillus ghanensis]|uniref:helix-turn-helix transcriptional regulator n=1 Tax=Liquorilactobacillus ghanensis TaxID=399370 RepID=UPI0039E7ABD7
MNQLLALLKELHLASNISIFVYDHEQKLVNQFKQTVSPSFPNRFLTKIDFSLATGSVKIFNTSRNECFSVISLPENNRKILVLWCNVQTIAALGYFRDSFPSISLERLISYTKILYFSLFQKLPVIEQPNFISDFSFVAEEKDEHLTETDVNIYHNSYYKEKLMLQALEKGILVEFRPRLADFINSGTFGKMAVGNELRNSKNLLIAATTLFTRAAIKGGMHPESAYMLSDRCVQRIERLNQIDSIVDLIQEIGEIFVKRVRAAQSFSNSSLIFLIQDYVFKNLAEPINLTLMAKQLGYSKNYLCRSFKQATNQTIVDYANEQKIREIQSQLIFSHKTVTEIAAMLGFYDQSYLTKLFKKYLHTTPTQFRKKYHI